MTRRRNKIKLGKRDMTLRIVAYVFTSVWIIALLLPLYWMFLTSVKDQAAAYKIPPAIFPKVPSAYSVDIDASGRDYSDGQFTDDSLIILWSAFEQFPGLNIGKLTVNRIEGNRIVKTAAMTLRFFKTNRNVVFPGDVTPYMIIFRKNDLLELMNKAGCFKAANKTYKRPAATAAASEMAAYLNGLQMTDRNGDNPRNAFAWENPISGSGATANFWGLFVNFSVAFGFFKQNGVTFLRFLLNSFIIAAAAVILQWLITAAAGYGLARLVPKKAENVLTTFFVGTMMIPSIVSIVPLYALAQRLNLMNNYFAVVLPGVANAVALVLFKGFFADQPREMTEAARIDGAGEFGIYWRFVVPLALPVFGIIAILAFTGSWNDILWPSMVLKDTKVKTFPVIISMMMNYTSDGKLDYPLVMAMSVIAALPTFILYIFFQRQMTQGIVFSGLKG